MMKQHICKFKKPSDRSTGEKHVITDTTAFDTVDGF
jgi:hypothetical protein